MTLRNAEAHEDYRFEPDTWEIVSLAQTEFRTDLDELDERIETLAGALEAAVAAFICFHIDSDYWVNAPTWITAGEAPALTEAWTIAILAAFGHHATAVRLHKDENSVEIDVSPPEEGLAADALLSVAVATAHLVHPDAVIHVRDAAADRELLAVDGRSVRRFSSADQDFKDLALWHVLVAARLSRGQTRDQAARDAVATMVLLIEHNDIGGLIEAVAHRDARPFRHLRRRLGYVRSFAAGFADCLPRNVDPLRALIAAEQAVALASRWDPRSLDRLEQALARLAEWRDAHASQSPTFGRFVD